MWDLISHFTTKIHLIFSARITWLHDHDPLYSTQFFYWNGFRLLPRDAKKNNDLWMIEHIFFISSWNSLTWGYENHFMFLFYMYYYAPMNLKIFLYCTAFILNYFWSEMCGIFWSFFACLKHFIAVVGGQKLKIWW